uniref:Uncharacterized protein n=1 Tax=Globisporangium ultimum (strain ATCC 200006 / CBS 805.95 / DAOM BR144) TaxID=431595 RepID=K3X2D8_GLOUD
MVYADLNVRHGGRICVAELQRLGYATVAVNAEYASNDKLKMASDLPPLQLTAADTKAGGKAIKKSKLYTPNVANALQLSSDAASTKNTVRQLKRITLKVEDMNGALALNTSTVIKSYDIVAAEATSAKVFQFLCEQADVDIITFDVTNRLSFQIKRPWVDAAIKRSIYFEITYTPCLGDSAGRRYFFSNASNLVRLTGGKHLLLSSGATRDILLRSPYDVINVGILVGLTYGQALDAISTSCLDVIAHADKRRGKVDVVAESSNSSEDVVMQG